MAFVATFMASASSSVTDASLVIASWVANASWAIIAWEPWVDPKGAS